MNSITARFMSFITVAICIALFVLGLIVFSYILVFIVLAGVALFTVGYLRMKLAHGRKKPPGPPSATYKGRIIEHEKD
jgi:hypothetical protein